GVFEGETVDAFRLPNRPALALRARSENRVASVDLPPRTFNAFHARDRVRAPELTLDDIGVEVLAYVPDSEVTERITDDNPQAVTAVRASLSPSGSDNPTWLFAGQTGRLGPLSAALRSFGSKDQLDSALAPTESAGPESDGVVKVSVDKQQFEIPLKKALADITPIGETGRTIRALRYVPSALVVGGQVQDNPRGQPNPAIQVEISGPDSTEKQWVFARFPNFRGMHGDGDGADISVTFVAPKTAPHRATEAPIQILAGPDNALYVRFETMGHGAKIRQLTPGTTIESPWPNQKFTVLDRYDRARRVRDVTPVTPVRQDRFAAIRVKLHSGEQNHEVWVQRYRPHAFRWGGRSYELTFGDKEIPLGFGVRLDKFEIGYYPGERRPRSFTSKITITDPGSGGTRSEVISMNNPASYGGYNFYQSSYRQGKTRTASFLSVARDPGIAIVFIGYGATMAGMVIVLVTRSIIYRRNAKRSRSSDASAKTAAPQGGSRKSSERVATPAAAK
ncbi:MAG: cytochrome c biogenesis protein ResB, partial [Phycisphaerae bacterium]